DRPNDGITGMVGQSYRHIELALHGQHRSEIQAVERCRVTRRALEQDELGAAEIPYHLNGLTDFVQVRGASRNDQGLLRLCQVANEWDMSHLVRSHLECGYIRLENVG